MKSPWIMILAILMILTYLLMNSKSNSTNHSYQMIAKWFSGEDLESFLLTLLLRKSKMKKIRMKINRLVNGSRLKTSLRTTTSNRMIIEIWVQDLKTIRLWIGYVNRGQFQFYLMHLIWLLMIVVHCLRGLDHLKVH